MPPPDVVREAAELTDYAVVARYPGVYEDVVEAEYHRAVELADRVVTWAVRVLDAAVRQEAEARATSGDATETPRSDTPRSAERLKTDE